MSCATTPTAAAALVWFRHTDLRTLDHAPLSTAHRDHASVLHAFCVDPRLFHGATTASSWPGGAKEKHVAADAMPAFPKVGRLRAKFLIEALEDLQSRLRAAGSDLVVVRGKPEVALPALVADHGVAHAYCHRGESSEEMTIEARLEAALATAGVRLHSLWGGTLFHRDDLPFSAACGSTDWPATATKFRKRLEAECRVRPSLPRPAPWKPPPPSTTKKPADASVLPTVDELLLPSTTAAVGRTDGGGVQQQQLEPRRPPLPPPADVKKREQAAGDVEVEETAGPRMMVFRGGETAALARLEDYTFGTDLVAGYKKTRDGLLGADYSTKLSPFLSHGCVSPRTVHEAVQRYEAERVKNKSTYWVFFELIVRDFFRFFALHHGPRLYALDGPKGVQREWRRDLAALERWCRGTTGVPLVDANMRELKATGYMSNRGRQCVASFLVHDLKLDWRWGAQWFESQLLDHDPCSNYGNWSYQAGVGCDPRKGRYFKISKQARKFDPEGAYMKHWLPGLAGCSVDQLAEARGLPQEGGYPNKPMVEVVL